MSEAALAATRVRATTPAFAARLQEFGGRIALFDEAGEGLTYRDLAARADEFAAQLGDTRRLVLIEAANEIAAVIAYLGALRGGHPVILAAEGAGGGRLHGTYAPDAVFARHNGSGWVLFDQGCWQGHRPPFFVDGGGRFG